MTHRRHTTVATIAFLTIASVAPAAQAQSVGVGSGGGVRVGGGAGVSPDPILNSAAMGAALGAAGGPIGMAIGAGVGILHGLWTKRKYEEQARAEQERQRAMDRELEREMAAQRAGGGPGADTEEGQGVLIVADNLASDSASASPTTERATQVASLPPAPSRESAAARAPDAVDTEGFRAIYEGKRLVRREHRAPDGSVDVVLHYDERGRIVQRDESSRMDGRLDTSAHYADGTLQRKESDTDGDGKPDVWAFYDGTGELTRLESVASDGRRQIEQYRAGRVAERLEGDLLSVFDDAGRLVKQGRKGNGEKMLAWRYYEPSGTVTREEEFDAEGKLSAVAHYEGGRVVRRELYQIDEQAFKRVPVVSTEAIR
jgi:antitoxin component YwqK of YwqJK toxin-antitoxin module